MSEYSKIRIIAGDPGRTNDPFGIVILDGTWPQRKIYVRGAKQFIKRPYSEIADFVVSLKRDHNPDMILIEKNFDYDNIKKTFEKYDLQPRYITTSANLTDEKNSQGYTVDKPYMIKWLAREYLKNTVQWPQSKMTKDMQQLINQRSLMTGITAPSGHSSSKAQRNRHDDLFMAKLIGCNAIRLWWDNNQ